MTGKMGLLPSAHTHPCSGSTESQGCAPHGLGKRAEGALPFWITGLTWPLGPFLAQGWDSLFRGQKKDEMEKDPVIGRERQQESSDQRREQRRKTRKRQVQRLNRDNHPRAGNKQRERGTEEEMQSEGSR